ncbi:MAG TPA: tyrosine--tRNA ligase [Hadesarchaea archaeon]|nr:tyrosine--tRNA ligase [Hadesarchaea archaeon]
MTEEKFNLVARCTTEIITEEELRELLKHEKFVAYCGYEPSGKIHFGHLLTIRKLIDLQAAGAKPVVLLADLHAYLNHKGTLEEIRLVAEYNKHCFIALGLDPKRTEFLLGSDFQLKPRFMMDVLRVAADTTLLRARRSMTEIAKRLEDPDVAQVLYPIMQAVDMAYLKVDVAVGGNDQRKVHMVAREKLPALGHQKPVCVHVPLLHGTDGAAKMSSSKGNFIAIDDEPSTIKQKIEKTFCPPKQTKDNPIIEYTEHIVLPSLGKLETKRPARYGGPLELINADELRKLYAAGKLHPADLKAAVAEALVKALAPVREYFEKHPDARLARPSQVL